MGTGAPSAGSEADPSPPYSAEADNVLGYTYIFLFAFIVCWANLCLI